mmetsp:Transcript_29077/g.43844  ORF Transcript_29077/g.43844 Transcript_29077/m.43844 type:complete len:129 (-) Transcript_29077:37-423(-)
MLYGEHLRFEPDNHAARKKTLATLGLRIINSEASIVPTEREGASEEIKEVEVEDDMLSDKAKNRKQTVMTPSKPAKFKRMFKEYLADTVLNKGGSRRGSRAHSRANSRAHSRQNSKVHSPGGKPENLK